MRGTAQLATDVRLRSLAMGRVDVLALAWIASAVAVGLSLRFHDLDRESLWLDEAGRAAIALLPPDRIGAGVAALELSPPLYHYVLAAWANLIGSGDGSLRALSALLVVPSVAAAWSLGKAVGGPSVAAGLAVVVAVNPFAVHYGQEAAMYALLLPLSLATMRAAIGVLEAGPAKAKRWFAAYGVAGGLALATHYYAAFLLGTIALVGVTVAARSRSLGGIAAWLGVHGAIALALAPWAPAALGQAQLAASVADWVAVEPVVALNLWAAGITADGAPPWQAARALALLGAGMAVGTWRLRSRPAIALALVMLTVLPVAGAIALSGSVDLFRVRGLLAAAGAPWALLVAGVLAGRVQGVPDAGVRLALGAALLAAIGSGTAHHATEGKEDWRGAAAFVAARAGPDDPIFFVHYAAQVAFDRYFHGPQPRIGLPQSFHWEEGYRAPYRVTPADVERVVPPALEVRRRAWVVLSHDAGRGSEHLLRVLDGWGERREDTMRRGVRVVGYSR